MKTKSIYTDEPLDTREQGATKSPMVLRVQTTVSSFAAPTLASVSVPASTVRGLKPPAPYDPVGRIAEVKVHLEE
ncbi:hypothetical protein HPB47_022928 [Ixodes persulcatus]|uniref:Uncharacterized protein n=1 Tax=Ixodes persulcatus TaxID=34615 RepID=A0AC60Q8C5_IXOPE|nr:hypothetical protein HPB47_022928 [Ixodes persulcatus]